MKTYKKKLLKQGYYYEFKSFYDSLPEKLSTPEKYIEKVNTKWTIEEDMVKGNEPFSKEEAFGLVCKIIKENDTKNKYNLVWFKDDNGGLCGVSVWLNDGGWRVDVGRFVASYEWSTGDRSFFRNENLDTLETRNLDALTLRVSNLEKKFKKITEILSNE